MTRRDKIRAKIAANVVEVPCETPGLEGPCRLWQGGTSGDGRGGGYARMSLDGATVAVHIASWVNENGLIPPRKQLDHMCRRRNCVAEPHLELVTARQNAKRREAAKGG
ncbi:HNH endonuclease [Ruegeria litorea]|nr:HNH endonuclease [Falsiruegeria litorea]